MNIFHLILTTVYVLPLVYVYFRVKRLFIPGGCKNLYTVIFILPGALYPVFNIFLDEGTGSLFNFFAVAGLYALVFFLYVFVLTLLFDIFLLLNRLFRFSPRPVLKNPRQKTRGLLIMVSLSIAIVITGIINFKTIRTARYSIEIPQKAPGMDQLRIAYIADFHLQPKTSVRYVKKVVNRINAIQPDLMLFGGDIVEGDGDEGKLARFEKLLGQVKSKYGSYGVIGNHEIYGGNDVDQFFRDAEIKLLKDTTVVIGSAINLAGRLDQHIKDRKPPEEILRQANDSLPVILLDHRPTRIQEISQTRADIQLSGHTHNGQLFPFNLITQSIYPISWGYEVINNTHFIVTSGIRLWGPPVRTAGRSEIVVVDLTFR